MINKIIEIARTAGRMILERPEFAVEEKTGHANFVTTIDKKVQEYIEANLLTLLPGSVMIGEEKTNSALTDGYTWIVDPVDGTTNLIHDYRMSAVSIALFKDKKPVIGVIFQPYTDEMFTAEKGNGAFLNGKPIHVSDNDYAHALVSIGTSPYNPELAKKSLSLALTYLNECADIRRSGSAAIDLVNLACGRTDFYFEFRLSPWDFAAGALIVTEAGGIFDMPLNENGVDFSKPAAVFASNRKCFDEAKERFLKA